MMIFPNKSPEKFTLLDYIRDAIRLPFDKIDTRNDFEHTLAGTIDVVLSCRAECTNPEGLSFDLEHAIVIALMDLSRHDVIDFSKIADYANRFDGYENGDKEYDEIAHDEGNAANGH